MNSKLKLIIYRNSCFIKSQIFRLDQTRGGKKLTIKYKNNKYTFEEAYDENYYILYSIDKNPFFIYCVAIVISKEFKTAEIHGINNFESCMIQSNIRLLQITIKMLQKYKTKLDINYIVLTDNSLKKCNNKDIKLSTMLTLLTGDTWYGKYGFRPYNISKKKINKKFTEYYENNKNIMNNITILQVNILKYIEKTENIKLIKATQKLLLTNPEMLLKDYLTNLLKQYNERCNIFYIFYEDIFHDIIVDNNKLYDFHHNIFALKLN